MFSPASFLGITASPNPLSPTPNKAPYYLILHFVLAYAALSTRGMKIRLKIDNNVCPREDVATRGEAAVKSGKMTREQLEMLKRAEANHANAVENYSLFVGAMVAGLAVGVDGVVSNRCAVAYTVMRVVYSAMYLLITDRKTSFLRSIVWWGGNLSCLGLLWRCGEKL